MEYVTHTVKWQYGPGSGTTTVRVPAEASMDAVRAAVRRKLDLNYLAMCSESYRVVGTSYDND